MKENTSPAAPKNSTKYNSQLRSPLLRVVYVNAHPGACHCTSQNRLCEPNHPCNPLSEVTTRCSVVPQVMQCTQQLPTIWAQTAGTAGEPPCTPCTWHEEHPACTATLLLSPAGNPWTWGHQGAAHLVGIQDVQEDWLAPGTILEHSYRVHGICFALRDS